MVDGGENIIEAKWSSVSGIINKGGTVIGSARCQSHKTFYVCNLRMFTSQSVCPRQALPALV